MFQAPLKQFSRWLASRQHVTTDHMAGWRRLPKRGPARQRRALLPEEFAAALIVDDVLDAVHGRVQSSRLVWTVALVSGARITALSQATVADLDVESKRIRLLGNETKRAGAAMLDDATFSELRIATACSRRGPLLLSPDGGATRQASHAQEMASDTCTDICHSRLGRICGHRVRCEPGGSRVPKSFDGDDQIVVRGKAGERTGDRRCPREQCGKGKSSC